MRKIKELKDVKDKLQAGFDNNEDSLEAFGKTYSTQLKAYLIESNLDVLDDYNCPSGVWERLDVKYWFKNKNGDFPDNFFLDTSRDRIWVLYSTLEATQSDLLVEGWVSKTKGLDNCWLSRNQLMLWEGKENWKPRGIGLRFNDGLTPEVEQGHFSLKAWFGSRQVLEGLDPLLQTAKDAFAIHSARWQKRQNGNVLLSSEWYSNGKVTVNRADDVDETFIHIGEMANKYLDSLLFASELRDSSMGAFEINYSQKIDLDAFTETVLKGTGEMKLWLVETESEPDFKRFRGVDLHTWDRILIDIGLDYAYITIPKSGCVNAAPRIAVVQGEDNAGKTTIYHDGDEIFV